MKKTDDAVLAVASTLVDLATEAAQISRLIMESDGELTPELEARLDVNAESLMKKVDSYNYVLDDLAANEELWKKRKAACAMLEKRFKTHYDNIRERVKLAMKQMEVTEIAGNQFRFQIRNTKPKLVIDDESKIPESYTMVVTQTVIDTERVTEALKAGFKVEGAHLEENGALYILNGGKK